MSTTVGARSFWRGRTQSRPEGMQRLAPLRLILLVVGAIVVVEMLDALFFNPYHVTVWEEALTDILLLLLVLAPVLYLFLYQPLQQELVRHQQAEEEIRQLSLRLLQAREAEERRLALDLHDELGQSLSALRLELEALKQRRGRCSAGPGDDSDFLINRVQQIHEQVRTISARLRPSVLDDLGIVAALEWLIDEMRKNQPQLVIEFDAIGIKRRPVSEVETTLYRLVQEGLTNVIRHASASRVQVRLTASFPDLVLSISDDGRGLPAEQEVTQGLQLQLGVLGMRERVRALGGRFSLQSRPGAGTHLRAVIPSGSLDHGNN